jgi:hypothetical protein
VVDAIAAWLREEGAEIDGEAGERGYAPCYYAVFFSIPTGSSSRWSTSRSSEGAGSAVIGP